MVSAAVLSGAVFADVLFNGPQTVHVWIGLNPVALKRIGPLC